MKPSASSLVPGIAKYPELESQLTDKIAKSGCCDGSRLAQDFRNRLQARLERDKWLKRP